MCCSNFKSRPCSPEDDAYLIQIDEIRCKGVHLICGDGDRRLHHEPLYMTAQCSKNLEPQKRILVAAVSIRTPYEECVSTHLYDSTLLCLTGWRGERAGVMPTPVADKCYSEGHHTNLNHAIKLAPRPNIIMISEDSPELAVLWNNLIGVQRPQPLIGIVAL